MTSALSGGAPFVRSRIGLILIAVVVLSILPIVIDYVRERRRGNSPKVFPPLRRWSTLQMLPQCVAQLG